MMQQCLYRLSNGGFVLPNVAICRPVRPSGMAKSRLSMTGRLRQTVLKVSLCFKSGLLFETQTFSVF